MAHVVYVGALDAVDVPSLRISATRNVPVEVPDDAAAALLEQADNWQPVTAPAAAKSQKTPKE